MIIPILVSALAGTITMTLYSYVMSKIRQRQFSEPEILANLLVKILPFNFLKTGNFLVGSLAHYAMGIAFMVVYWLLWNYTTIRPTFLFGAIAGPLSGLVGVGVWELTFIFHPHPPEIDKKRYYGQLIMAHLVFAITATESYKWLYS